MDRQDSMFRGSFALPPDILKSEQPYAQVDGSNSNKDLVSCIVFFDSPGDSFI